MSSKDSEDEVPQGSDRSGDQASSGNSGAWVAIEAKPGMSQPEDVAGNKTIETEEMLATDKTTPENILPWVQTYVNPIKVSVVAGSLYSSLRPLKEFLLPSSFSKPSSSDVVHRIKENGRYFWANYCAATMLVTLISVVTNPTLLLVTAVLTVMWWKAFDIDCSMFGIKSSRRTKTMIMTLLSIFAMIYFASSVIFWSLGSSALFSITHATLHKPPIEEGVKEIEEDLEVAFLEK